MTARRSKYRGIVLCLYTGLRIGELPALEWSDIDFEKGILSVTKTCRDGNENGRRKRIIDTPKTERSRRNIPLSKTLVKMLKEMKKHSKCSFVGKVILLLHMDRKNMTKLDLLKCINIFLRIKTDYAEQQIMSHGVYLQAQVSFQTANLPVRGGYGRPEAIRGMLPLAIMTAVSLSTDIRLAILLLFAPLCG